jgi:hypothetical protein
MKSMRLMEILDERMGEGMARNGAGFYGGVGKRVPAAAAVGKPVDRVRGSW